MLVNGNIAIEAVAAFGRGFAAAGVVTAGVAVLAMSNITIEGIAAPIVRLGRISDLAR
jgi:hypothetical protein